MSDALIEADAEARAAALDPRRSILLQAPAGSGKTAVLTQRFLRLLCTVDEPDAILAITFTLKAAAEMRTRIMRALRGEVADSDPCAAAVRTLASQARRHAAARGWKLLDNPAVLRIQTIDAFNYWLASQLPLAARAGGLLNITETPGALYRRAAQRTLAAAEGDVSLGAALELLFERLDNQYHTVERLLAQMLELRGHWLRYVLEHEPQRLCARVNQGLADIVRTRLAALEATLPRALRHAAQSLPGVGTLGTAADSLPAWKRLASLTLTREGWRRTLSARFLGTDFETPAACAALRECIAALRCLPGLESALRAVAALPAATLSAADGEAIAALSRVLAHAAAQLQAQFAEAGRVDYTYVTGAARAALTETGEPTELALRTGLALRHILVDEFQDTSLAQFELLESLTVGWEEGDGRTLFVVGDPMQSIYRFRDAEVGLFIAARARGIGPVRLTPLRLTRNFRATPPLVEWVNRTFAQVLPAADDLQLGAVAFSASVAAGQAPTGSAAGDDAGGVPVRLRLFPDDRPGEARAIAASIAELRQRDPGGSVAVLVSAHAHATAVIVALRERGIAALGVDLVPLAQRPIVRDLVQLSRALHDLADRNAWLAVLRAPWCGARLATLTVLSAPDSRQLLWEALADPRRLARCQPGEAARLARLHAVLTAALERGTRLSEADWLESTWVQLGAPDAYPAADLEDARAFFTALAARCAAGEWRTPEDFAALLEDLYSVPQASAEQPVAVMTIHRAKGLEFDHVFLPALERSSRGSERALLGWVDLPRAGGGSDLLLAPVPPIGETADQDIAALIQQFTSARAAHERARLLYVAATRARASLHLSAAPRPRADGRPRVEGRTLLGCLWPVLGEEFVTTPVPTGAAAPHCSASPPLQRLSARWRAPELPAAPPATRLPLGRASLEPPEFSWVGETQRHIGTIVHRLLAAAADRDPLPGAAQIERERRLILGQLRHLGVPEHERPEAAEVIVTALRRALEDERGRWILAAGHRERHSELSLTGIADGRLRSVVIDRCFVDDSGTRWVIDYKTSRHEGGALETFLGQEIERYRAQLTGYVALAAALGPEPVRAALYFPLLGAFRELT